MSTLMTTRASDKYPLYQCPMSWTLRKLYPERQRTETVWFARGTILHEIIERATEDGLSLGIALERANQAVSEWEHRTKGQKVLGDTASLRPAVDKMLRQWYETCHPDGSKRHPFYENYQWKPRTEVSFYRSAEDAGTAYPISGTVDAVHEGRDGFAVVDYKAGRPPKDPWQLSLYRFGLGLPEGTKLAYHMLSMTKPDSIIREVPDIGDRKVRGIINQIEQHKAFIFDRVVATAKKGHWCRECDVRDLCIARGNGDEKDLRARIVEIQTQRKAA